MREIRRIGRGEIAEYTEIYVNAYPAFKSLDEECIEHCTDKTLEEMAEDDDVDFIGLYEDGELIAQMKVVHFQINLYGKMKSAFGLMALAVHRLHKKRHAATDLINEFEHMAEESGALVCVLLPFKMGFYTHFGYGLGTKLDEYRFPTAYLPEYDPSSYLRKLDLHILSKEDNDIITACSDEVCERCHGMMKKFSEEVRIAARDESSRRIGCFDADRLAGYVRYKVVPDNDTNYTLNTIVCEELVYEDSQVLRALLGVIRAQSDLAETVVIRTGEEDFYHILKDPADTSGNYIDYGFLQTNISALGTMYKIPDFQSFIENTSYRRFPVDTLTAEFRCSDSRSGAESTFTIHFEGGFWRLANDDEAEYPDITCAASVGTLSSIFMGSASLLSLARLGQIRVKVRDASAVQRLSALLRVDRKPFSNNDY
ncbi:MAG: GNAT family N-acetyltransferase [Eubacterium sp.]|jgi:predicted acetyltransferase